MRTTGPILAIGGITMVNESIVNGQPIDWRVPIATAVSVGLFSLAEHVWPAGAIGFAWIALVTVLFVRLKPNVPAPAESFNKWIGYATS